jgi:predicted metalloprotease
MTFRNDARLDTSRIQRRGASAGAGGMVIGGGLGSLVILLIAMFTGFDLSSLGLGSGNSGSTVTANNPELQQDLEQACQTGADANARVDCLITATINSLDAYWESAAPAAGVPSFTYPGVVLYDSMTSTPCGTASDQTGPFYCPPDQTIYVDTTFFNILTQFGSSNGQLAQEYVIAHEYGHHIQNLLGVFEVADRGGTGANSDSVKVELMADCLAGVWANHASSVEGGSYLEPLTKQDIADALSAASSVGDDHIQQATQGSVDQDSFTHGTSAQREDNFLTGYRSGDAGACDYFNVVR